MSAPRWPAVWLLGAGQCVYWGILYYAYAVLLVPMRDEFAVSEATVAGAFSAGLAVSALLAAVVGHRLDRGDGLRLFRGGAVAATALFVAWSFVQNIAQLYAVWLGLGTCMALVLYEAAFALVTRAIDEPGQRLRALASVTVCGGLASTVFLPLVGAGVEQIGWRWTLRGLAAIWAVTTLVVLYGALPAFARAGRKVATVSAVPDHGTQRWTQMATVGTPFVVATFTAMAMTTLLIPRLVDQGHPIAAASWVLAALGIMQLPGRLWMLRRSDALSARHLLMTPLLLQIAGLLVLAIARPLALAAVGVAIFGIGAGLHTLARPWVVPQRFGVASAGRINGRIARAQGMARAAGPFVAAAVAGRIGTPMVFGLLAFALLACLPLAATTTRRLADVPSSTD